MKKTIILILSCLVFFNGCSIQVHGDDLQGFILRLNEYNTDYNLTEKGFIFSKDDSVFYKFIIIEENEILLSFTSDSKNRLVEMNIVLKRNTLKLEAANYFIANALKAFINNSTTADEILNSNTFSTTLNSTSLDTISIKNGNIELLLDATEFGTVITVYKDI